MTALYLAGLCLAFLAAFELCAALRAPTGFQTDRGFFYGIPDQQESEAQAAAERLHLGVGGGADRIHAHSNRTTGDRNHA